MAAAPVLVIGDDTRSFLSVVRSLGRLDVEVHAAPYDHASPALASRYISKVHRLPPYEASPAEWVSRTRNCIASHGFSLVVPCDDRSFIPLVKHRREIDGALPAVIGPEAFDTFYDKQRTRQLANELDVPVARGRPLRREDTYEHLASEFGTRLVIKPRRSYTETNLTVRGSVQYVADRRGYESAVDRTGEPREYIVESYFEGKGVGVSVLAEEGRVLAAFQHCRIHEPPTGGSSYRMSEPLDRGLLDAAAALCRATTLTGVAMFEFRRGKAADWILVEVNARFWGSLPLALSAGVDFPALLYRLLVSGTRPHNTGYRTPCYARNMTNDYHWFSGAVVDTWRSGRRSAAARTLIGESLSGALRFALGRESIDTLSRGDTRPFTRELRELLGTVAGSFPPRLRPLLALRRRATVRRARRILSRCSHTPKVLFVCLGNICRSPFAELLLARASAEASVAIEVGSCGTLPFVGRTPPEYAVDVARRFGVDLSSHRSRFFSPDLAAKTDIVFVFDRRTWRAARGQGLGIEPLLLADLASSAGGEIGDPYGMTVDGCMQTYLDIQRGVARLVRLCQQR